MGSDAKMDVELKLSSRRWETFAKLAEDHLRPEKETALNAQLSGKSKSFGQDGAGITVTYKNCSTSGAFGFYARFRAEKGEIKVTSLDVTTPRAFNAQALVRLQVNKTVELPVLSTSIPLFTSQLSAVLIPGVLELGPKYEIGLGIEISAIAGDLDVMAGGSVTVPVSSTPRLNMLSQDSAGVFNAKGWKADIKEYKAEAHGFKGAKVVTSLRPSVAMVMDVLGFTSFTAEVFAKTPFVASTLKDVSSGNCSACGDHENGFQGDFALGVFFGARLKATVGVGIPIPIPLRSITFAKKQVPIGGFCAGSDPAGSTCPGIREANKAKAPPGNDKVEDNCGPGC